MVEPPAPDKEIDLSIVIVSWNVRRLLCQCLASIDQHSQDLRLQVIVVDSGSVDGTAEIVAQQYPWVLLLAQEDNVGFPRGNNIGMRHALGRNILLLNPDTIVVNRALQSMVAFMDEHHDVGVVGPCIRFPDGTLQSSRRRFPTVVTAFFESTWLEPWAPSRLLRTYKVQDLGDQETGDVDWVMGAAMMVRREIIAQVGMMDEAYFMYSEELDWCRRIKAHGWRVVYFADAEIIHHEGKSSEQAVTARHINFQRAKLRYFRKYYGRLFSTILRVFLLASYAWQLVVEAIKAALGHKRAMRRQRVWTYWQVLKSGLRPAGY